MPLPCVCSVLSDNAIIEQKRQHAPTCVSIFGRFLPWLYNATRFALCEGAHSAGLLPEYHVLSFFSLLREVHSCWE